jgi:hypothetical protein
VTRDLLDIVMLFYIVHIPSMVSEQGYGGRREREKILKLVVSDLKDH